MVFDESLIEFQNIIAEGMPEMSQKVSKCSLISIGTKRTSPLKGSKKGIQVMGLLETRLLDFNHIIALGMNEGKLPATNQVNSFIPMDLRAALGLSTTRENKGFLHIIFTDCSINAKN